MWFCAENHRKYNDQRRCVANNRPWGKPQLDGGGGFVNIFFTVVILYSVVEAEKWWKLVLEIKNVLRI